MEQAKRLVVYCNKSDLHTLKRFYRMKKYKAEIITDIQIDRGDCLFDYSAISILKGNRKDHKRKLPFNKALFCRSINRSVLKRNCNIHIFNATDIDDITINRFVEIEG